MVVEIEIPIELGRKSIGSVAREYAFQWRDAGLSAGQCRVMASDIEKLAEAIIAREHAKGGR